MKRLIFMLLVFMAAVAPIVAQDDNESILTSDIEVDGFDNFWVQSRLSWSQDPNAGVIGFRQARPRGGTAAFLAHVHTYTSKLFSALARKYPEEMLARVGSTSLITIEFDVTEQGDVNIVSITNGTLNGFDADISRGIFDTYRQWSPASLNSNKIRSTQTLSIEVSM